MGTLVLTDSIGNYCKIPIENITRINFQQETSSIEKPRQSVWSICKDLFEKLGVKDLVIEDMVNDEFFSYVILDDETKIPIRPSDMAIMFMHDKNISININEKLLTKTASPSIEGLEEQLKQAVENEDFKLAAELKKRIEEERNN